MLAASILISEEDLGHGGRDAIGKASEAVAKGTSRQAPLSRSALISAKSPIRICRSKALCIVRAPSADYSILECNIVSRLTSVPAKTTDTNST